MRAKWDRLRIWLRDELKLLHDDINVKDQTNVFDGDDQGPRSKIRLICRPKCTRRGSTFDVSFELPTQLDDALESQAAVSGKAEGPLVKHRQGTTNILQIEVKSTTVPASDDPSPGTLQAQHLPHPPIRHHDVTPLPLNTKTMSDTAKTRILIISDTHTAPLVDPGSPDAGDNGQRPFRAPLPAADVLLHCGDITMMGYMHEYDAALDMLGRIDAPLKLVIAGNHDLSLDDDFYLRQSRGTAKWTNGERMHLKNYDPDMPLQARELWAGEKAKAKGVTFLDEGTHEFTLQNGARLKVCTRSHVICD